MTNSDQGTQQFSGLILLTGVDRPGISAALFETLAPFSVSVLDIEQLVIADRLVLSVLISLNPSHQSAIETDLEQCASLNDVDIATLFVDRPGYLVKPSLIDVSISAEKLHPRSVSAISSALHKLGANIESIERVTSVPLTINFTVSGVATDSVQSELASLVFEDGTIFTVKSHS